MRDAVLARFEKQAPASIMARLALEQAMPAVWIDGVFEANRQRQYPRELLFSTVVELISLVFLGLRPSLYAAARQMDNLSRIAGGTVRQGQTHRAALVAAPGTGQHPAPGANRVGGADDVPG